MALNSSVSFAGGSSPADRNSGGGAHATPASESHAPSSPDRAPAGVVGAGSGLEGVLEHRRPRRDLRSPRRPHPRRVEAPLRVRPGDQPRPRHRDRRRQNDGSVDGSCLLLRRHRLLPADDRRRAPATPASTCASPTRPTSARGRRTVSTCSSSRTTASTVSIPTQSDGDFSRRPGACCGGTGC